ncbi:MAG TPA: cellulase [Verrucomicrobiae bacterium]|jgi:photosystem II stability/assembly factor-like uncharacterized protein
MRHLAAIAVLIGGLLSVFAADSLTSTPYQWRNVAIGGGGFVTGILAHPREKSVMYARTDVGGAYRWDAANQKWIPITDWVKGIDFTGIESFAVDPSDANLIYLAAGIYRSARAAILRSTDRGQTWQITDVPFKMGGNESGRFNGERLVVDPMDGRILFFGSRHDGLWKSDDYGATWSQMENFPQLNTLDAPLYSARTNAPRRRFNFTPQEIGIVFVQFVPRDNIPGKPTTTLYAGVSAVGTNFFRSDDGGTNWSPVPGQPLGLRPNHAVRAPDGTIYLTYGLQAGPTRMTDGAVWRFNPNTGAWTDITPLRSPDGDQPFGYGAVSVDEQNPSDIVVTTFARWLQHDDIFRSTNGGASWTSLFKNAQWDYSFAPYTKDRYPHWMGTVQIDPFDSNHILFTTGYGLWESKDLTDADAGKPTHWDFCDNGLEETVPLALISPPKGAHLLSGLGDIDGFRHDDLNVSPPNGSYAGVRFTSTVDLAFAAQNPSIIVRVGSGGNNPSHGAISRDGGKNWTAFPNGPTDGYGAGSIVISADGKTIVQTMRGGTPAFSGDNGTNWAACAGLPAGALVAADAVNPSRFYAFDARNNQMYASTNGAQQFSQTGATLPPESDPPRFGYGNGELAATPGHEGDVWLALHSGLFHSTDGGANFTRLDNTQEAYALGFGKAADGKNFPTLYLSGQIAGVAGIFRSTDTGASWTRINDDAHQFGAITHLTGDPRIFGRVYLATSGRGVIYGDENK